jgi:hypothetical protein
MEDLLQAQFDNELNLLLFDGMATFSIDSLVAQINKSELLTTKYMSGSVDADAKQSSTRVRNRPRRPAGKEGSTDYA